MTVSEALSARRSMRAFKPDAIEREKLVKVLKDASMTPSWANSQPWEICVAEGETLQRIKNAYTQSYKDAVKSDPEVARPKEWTEAAKKRQQGLYPDMLRDCGDAASQFGPLNQRMFDAPVVIFLCMDKMLSNWSLYDLGAYSQSLMLSAVENGLGTIPAVTTVTYPQVLRKELKIPDHLQIVIGIAIGYVDEDNKINNFRSARSPIEENVTFCG
jgi:nitroreductase